MTMMMTTTTIMMMTMIVITTTYERGVRSLRENLKPRSPRAVARLQNKTRQVSSAKGASR